MSHTIIPPSRGLRGNGRSAQSHYPTMMTILNNPAQTIHRNASVSSSSMSRSFNTLQTPSSLGVAITSSSSIEQRLPHHGQGAVQEQYLMSSPSPPNENYHLSTYGYQTTVPNIDRNMIGPQTTYPHHPPAGLSATHNIHDNVATVPRTNNTVQFQNAYAAPNSFRIDPHYDNTPTSTNLSPSSVPVVGSGFDFHSPQVESRYNHPLRHEPWEQSQTPAYLSVNPGFNRSGHGSRLANPPIQPYGGLLHGGDPHQGSLHHTPHSPTEEVHRCHWLRGDNVPCGFSGSQDLLKRHIISEHLSQEAQIMCRWIGCQYSRRGQPEVRTMRRDSAWRHVREKHLDDKFRQKGKAL